jgi:hypothetical protein
LVELGYTIFDFRLKIGNDNQAICSRAPGFIRGARKKLRIPIASSRIYQWARFLQSSIKNRKSKVLGDTIFDFPLKIEDWQ